MMMDDDGGKGNRIPDRFKTQLHLRPELTPPFVLNLPHRVSPPSNVPDIFSATSITNHHHPTSFQIHISAATTSQEGG